MGVIMAILLFLVILGLSCGTRDEIPGDVSYEIIDSSTMLHDKRSLDIRLSRKVSAETLRAIALKLQSQDSHDYDRTFIIYYTDAHN